ncbi:MAG: hypothetical protein JO062_09665 [Bryobacterales bacterium]|nr:hypothetical protein [Bryobacterales bacterium]
MASERDFDPVDYVYFLRGHWRVIAGAVALAAIIAAVACLLLPKQYTATATLVIEPPGVDPRAAIAVSPVYLESLKSYEAFASSDSLFATALQKFGFGTTGAPIESLKKRVLRVEKLKDTKLLEINVTLPDPKRAHEVAQYLAEQTVALDTAVARSGDRELLEDAERKFEQAKANLDKTRVESDRLKSAGSEALLESEGEALATLQGKIEADRIDTSAMVSESVARGDQSTAEEVRARVATLESQLAGLQKNLSAKSAALAGIVEQKRRVTEDLKTAQDVYDTARKREYEVSNVVKFRTGQLHIIDPGIVPQKPSFPNLPLALFSAAILSCGACLLWLTAQFGFARRKEQSPRAGLRVAGGGGR